jgi:hypothetical protein
VIDSHQKVNMPEPETKHLVFFKMIVLKPSMTKYISTNMIYCGTTAVGVFLFATGVILYTVTALPKGRIKEI